MAHDSNEDANRGGHRVQRGSKRLPENDRTPAQGGGPAWVQGALRCGVEGGINTAPTVRATRSRSDKARRQGGYGDGGGTSFADLDRCLQVVAFVSTALFS